MNHKQEFTQGQIAERAKENSEFVSDVEQDTEIMDEFGLLGGEDTNPCGIECIDCKNQRRCEDG